MLAYSVIMLNTDLHNPQNRVGKSMSYMQRKLIACRNA